MRFTVLTAASALILAVQTCAQDLVAFSGANCTGDEGSLAFCNGGCINLEGRQSFEFLNGFAGVKLFTENNCTGEQFVFDTEEDGVCLDFVNLVSAGSTINSASCFSSE